MKTYFIIVSCLLSIFVCSNTFSQDMRLASNDAMDEQIQGLQKSMMSDKEVMNLIQSLQNDPDFEKALDDPEMMKAINENNIPALMNNPKFMKLMNNKTIKQIQNEMEE